MLDQRNNRWGFVESDSPDIARLGSAHAEELIVLSGGELCPGDYVPERSVPMLEERLEIGPASDVLLPETPSIICGEGDNSMEHIRPKGATVRRWNAPPTRSIPMQRERVDPSHAGITPDRPDISRRRSVHACDRRQRSRDLDRNGRPGCSIPMLAHKPDPTRPNGPSIGRGDRDDVVEGCCRVGHQRPLDAVPMLDYRTLVAREIACRPHIGLRGSRNTTENGASCGWAPDDSPRLTCGLAVRQRSRFSKLSNRGTDQAYGDEPP